jgi:ADP-heptose:LPS heptosyltransferase
MPADYKKILVMPAAGMGDFLMAAPAIKALRENYKTAYIAVFAHHLRGAAEIGKCLHCIDEVIDFPLKRYSWGSVISFFLSGFWPMFFKLKKEKFDVCFIFAHNPIRTIITKLLGVKVFENRAPGHPTQTALDLLTEAGIKSDKIDFGFVPPNLDITKYIPADSPRPYIGVHPFSGMKWRNWANYTDFIDMLPKTISVIILGKDAEHKTIIGRKNVIDLVNKLSVVELAGIISKLNLLVSIDSGPMHIGFAAGIPTLGIFNSVQPQLRLPLCSKVQHQSISLNQSDADMVIVKERLTKNRKTIPVDNNAVLDIANKMLKNTD